MPSQAQGHLHPHHGAMPDVHPTAWVAPGAHVIGAVSLAEGASIWYGAVLRGDVSTISIGRFSNVQDNTVIHADGPGQNSPGYPTTVGDYVTVGHAAILHGCTIEDEILVGMGAVLLNGSRIGSQTIIGARGLVSEGKEIPTRSLVLGIPGKVVRELTDAELAHFRRSATHYAELAQSHRQG